MTNDLARFFYLGGYAWYVFSAYTCVFIFLFMQWFFPWQRWRKYLRAQTQSTPNVVVRRLANE